jgi:hypothetical protein
MEGTTWSPSTAGRRISWYWPQPRTRADLTQSPGRFRIENPTGEQSGGTAGWKAATRPSRSGGPCRAGMRASLCRACRRPPDQCSRRRPSSQNLQGCPPSRREIALCPRTPHIPMPYRGDTVLLRHPPGCHVEYDCGGQH